MQTPRVILLLLALLCPAVLAAQTIVINEVMASNKSAIADEDADFSDWIELYNFGNSTVDLTGWHISDDEDSLNLWEFPAVVIPPNGFLLVFASKKDKASNELHTNFSISSKGEAIYLSNASGVLVDSLSPTKILPDRSFGRRTDADSNWYSFLASTPGASNSSSLSPAMSRLGGYYTEHDTLWLQSWTSQQEIRYTLDGSEPDANSLLYEGYIKMSSHESYNNPQSQIPTSYFWEEPQWDNLNGVIVRAAIFENSTQIGRTVTSTFFGEDLLPSSFLVPIVSIVTDPGGLYDQDTGILVQGALFDAAHPDETGNYFERGEDWERAAYVEMIEPDNSIAFSQHMGLKVHGAYRRREPQKSLRLLARSEYGMSKMNHQIFPDREVDEFKRVVLRSRSVEAHGAMIVDILAQRIVDGKLDVDNQAMRPAIVYLNGEFYGIEDLVEKQDRFYIESHYDVHKDSVFMVQGYVPYVVSGGIEAKDEFNALKDFMANNDLSISANYAQAEKLIDIPSFIDYHIAEIYFANWDWPSNNLKVWKPANGGKWRWLLYDLDYAMQEIYDHTLAHAMDPLLEEQTGEPSTTFLRNLMKNEDFKHQFITRFEQLIAQVFDPAITNLEVNAVYQDYVSQIDKHIARWGYPDNFEKWDADLKLLKNFLRLRPCVIRNILLDDYNYMITASGCSSYEFQVRNLVANPNPNDGSFTLVYWCSEPTLLNMTLVDMTGRIVERRPIRAEFGANEDYLIFHNAKPGLYTVRLESDYRFFNCKVMISE